MRSAARPVSLLAVLLACVAAALAIAAPASAANKFAAIAVEKTSNSATGVYGYGYDYPTRAAAEERALTECETRADVPADCKGVVWVRNGCAAVAVKRRSDDSISRIAWGIAETKSKAIQRAKDAAGNRSEALVWVCGGRGADG